MGLGVADFRRRRRIIRIPAVVTCVHQSVGADGVQDGDVGGGHGEREPQGGSSRVC